MKNNSLHTTSLAVALRSHPCLHYMFVNACAFSEPRARATVLYRGQILAPRVCTLILSVMRELTSPVIERVKNKLTYPAADEGQKICGIFSETALFKSYGVKKPTS